MIGAMALADVLPEEAFADPALPDRWATLGGVPEAIVRPGSTEEVSSVMSWASAEGVGVVAAGTGQRLGRATMSGRFIVVTSDRLTGIEIYEPADVTFTAKSGTSVAELARELRANRQWMPFDPADFLSRTLGGFVASGESGPLWMGYGELRNHVLGMTVVTGDGRVLKLGGRVVKNVAGFDLLKPMVGSRGTLAVITSVCMRAFPQPATDRVLFARAPGLAELVPAALAIVTAPVMPVSCVLCCGDSAYGEGAALVMRLHGAEATVDADLRTLEAHAGVTFDALDGAPDSGGTIRDAATPTVLTVSLLPSRLAEAVAALGPLGRGLVAIDCYAAQIRIGLAGLDVEEIRRLRDAIERLGGALAIDRAPEGVDPAGLVSEPSPVEVELTSRLEGVFDPKGVLWRGRS